MGSRARGQRTQYDPDGQYSTPTFSMYGGPASGEYTLDSIDRDTRRNPEFSSQVDALQFDGTGVYEHLRHGGTFKYVNKAEEEANSMREFQRAQLAMQNAALMETQRNNQRMADLARQQLEQQQAIYDEQKRIKAEDDARRAADAETKKRRMRMRGAALRSGLGGTFESEMEDNPGYDFFTGGSNISNVNLGRRRLLSAA